MFGESFFQCQGGPKVLAQCRADRTAYKTRTTQLSVPYVRCGSPRFQQISRVTRVSEIANLRLGAGVELHPIGDGLKGDEANGVKLRTGVRPMRVQRVFRAHRLHQKDRALGD